MNKRAALARVVKRYRLERAWTLERMARACDLDPRTIWNLENQRVNPHERTIAKLHRLIPSLSAPELELVTWGDEPAAD